jgi:anti-anti-sigma regulatory factor
MARKKACSIDLRDGHHVVVMGDMEIWDGADLALLRETLARLVDAERCKAIGVDLTFVKYIPSGFFGMLFDYAERGISVRVYSPQPHVAQMLWFREFFELVSDQTFKLMMRQQTATSAAERNHLAGKAPWVGANVPNVVPNKPTTTNDTHLASTT